MLLTNRSSPRYLTSMTLRIFLTAPNIEGDATGEPFVAWRWAEALSHEVDLTVFSFQRANRPQLQETLPKATVITAPMPDYFSRAPRFEAMAKPHYPFYMRAVRKALRAAEGPFDLAHQIMPQAARYPIPLRKTGVPYVVGPLGGALETPAAFRHEDRESAAWYTRARVLDRWRFRYDPWLRASYRDAALILGVAPYMQDILADIDLPRFEPVLELGVPDIPPLPDRPDRSEGDLRLLHVGRGARTKGLRDLVRAVGLLRDTLPGLTVTSAGTGPEIDQCRREAETLGVADRIRFLGQIAREDVEPLYAEADVFVFPSFREPAGNVLYEAMRWGLPAIAANRGGPAWIVDDTNGIRIDVSEPETYARDIAAAIQRLAGDPALRRQMGQAGQERLRREGLWPAKAKGLVTIYESVLAAL